MPTELIFGCVIVALLVIIAGVKYRERFSSKSLFYFYRPTCGHCTKFSPVWDEFTRNVKQNIQLHKVNCDDPSQSFICKEAAKYGMRGVPSIMLVDGEKRTFFNMERTVANLLKFIS